MLHAQMFRRVKIHISKFEGRDEATGDEIYAEPREVWASIARAEDRRRLFDGDQLRDSTEVVVDWREEVNTYDKIYLPQDDVQDPKTGRMVQNIWPVHNIQGRVEYYVVML